VAEPQFIDGNHSAKLLAEAMHTNYNLMDVNLRTLSIMGRNQRLSRRELDYYCRLNRGGRRIFGSSNEIPLALWPLVLERANRIYWGASTGNTDAPKQKTASHAADVVYCLLHGPILFTNPNFANNNDENHDTRLVLLTASNLTLTTSLRCVLCSAVSIYIPTSSHSCACSKIRSRFCGLAF
jgi:hypothetical protein